MSERPLTIEQAAAALNIGRHAVHKRIRGGRLAVLRLSDHVWRVLPSDLRQAIRQDATEPDGRDDLQALQTLWGTTAEVGEVADWLGVGRATMRALLPWNHDGTMPTASLVLILLSLRSVPRWEAKNPDPQ